MTAPGGFSGALVGPAVLGVAAYGMAGSRFRPPAGPLDQAEWAGLSRSCLGHRLVGLLAAAAAGGAVQVRNEQAAELAALEAQSAAQSRVAHRQLVQVHRELTAEGVDHRVLDGPVLARRAYVDPNVRHYTTVDVLVEPLSPLLRRHGSNQVRLTASLLPPSVGAPVGLSEVPEETIPIDGHAVPALPAEAQLIHACAHATTSADAHRLLAIRDVAQLALTSALDLERLVRLAGTWRITALVASTIQLTWATFDLADKTPLSAWASRYDATPAERRALLSYADAPHRLNRATAAALRLAGVLAAPVRRGPG
ncbi:MAG: nucleotidyltransferase family protein [Jiangellaceae bacterium]